MVEVSLFIFFLIERKMSVVRKEQSDVRIGSQAEDGRVVEDRRVQAGGKHSDLGVVYPVP
jgi:hypothetical protein